MIELEMFLLAVRAEVDAMLQPQQPVKLGKSYPLGQCLEITLAVQRQLRLVDASGFNGVAANGHVALSAFFRAGGTLRQIWGDLRGQFFQNAFLIGTLYVDVSNDTVVPTKPKVEILPFAKSQLTPIQDYLHFKRIAEGYWHDRIFPNHVLPELAAYCPLIHVSPFGRVRLYDPTRYMVAMTQATAFRASEDVLRDSAMPADLFALVVKNLQYTKLKFARTPEQGRIEALDHCRMYRAKRWHKSDRQKDKIVAAVYDANRRLATVVIDQSGENSIVRGGTGNSIQAIAADKASLPIRSVDKPPLEHMTNRMAQYVVVTTERHASKRWQRNSHYHFAAHDALCSLMEQELPQATMALPVAFIVSGEAFGLVAVQGLLPGKNAFVNSDGSWLAGYLPAAYRTYPFRLAGTENEQQLLCIDENSGLITDGPQGERFFDDEGKATKAITDVMNLLIQQEANRTTTANICAVLQKHNLIQPWPIKVQAGHRIQTIEGLYRIDEAALNALPPQAFIELRDIGALTVAYCQLLSMQNVQKLAKLM
jgi:hypothetical protein